MALIVVGWIIASSLPDSSSSVIVHFGFVIGMELFFLIGVGFHRIKGILSRSLSGAELFFFVMWPIPSLSPLAC